MLSIGELARDAVVHRGAEQVPEELEELGRLLMHHKVRDIVEIGTGSGGTAWFFYQLGLKVTTVDILMHRARLVRGITYLDRNSSASGVDCDAVFVDGDSSYVGVLADWVAWRGHVRKLAAFHNVAKPNSGPHRLWQALAVDYRTAKIDSGQGEGIGVVLLEKERNDRGKAGKTV